MKYDYFSPAHIVFGWRRRSELGALAAAIAKRVLLVSGSQTLERNGTIDSLTESIQQSGVAVQRFSVLSREPEVSDVNGLVNQFLQAEAGSLDCVVAIGGGSTIDLAKAAAALTTNRHGSSVVDFLDGVEGRLQIQRKPLTVIAVPTTAGTGAEVTKNAVISSFDPPFKKSLRSDQMIPAVVLIDPELSVSVPPDTTAYTGMDAITQLIESYISRRAAPIPQALARSGLKLAIPALPTAVRQGTSREAREAMAQAALLSGLSLANSGLGFAHGVAAALGVHCKVPHGLACAVMLPTALRVNQEVRKQEIAELESLFGDRFDADPATSFVQRIEAICREVQIPSRLREIGVTKDQIPDLVRGSRGNSMSGNPRDVSDQELTQLLEQAW